MPRDSLREFRVALRLVVRSYSKGEILRLIGLVARQGYTLVPLKAYFKRGRLKIELGMCESKLHAD